MKQQDPVKLVLLCLLGFVIGIPIGLFILIKWIER